MKRKKDTRAIPPTAFCEASLSASAAGPFRTPSRVVGSPHVAFLSKKREKERPGAFFNKHIKTKAPRSVCSAFCVFLRFLAPWGVCFDGGVDSVLYGMYTAIRHRVSPEFIGSRNFVPMTFTADENPLALGQ